MAKWKRVATIIILILLFFHLYSLLYSRYSRSDNVVKLRESVKHLLSQLKLLKQRHDNLVARIKESPSDRQEIEKLLADDLGPLEEYELLRRRIHSNTKEFWYFVSHVLGNEIDGNLEPNRIQTIIDDLTDRKRSLLFDNEGLAALDGHQEWRRQEAASVSKLVQRRLFYLQNPPDCRNARKLVCQLEYCGFGCQHHHLAYCLIFAYATKRTLILKRPNWIHDEEGWMNTFYPLSETCTSLYNDTVVPESGKRAASLLNIKENEIKHKLIMNKSELIIVINPRRNGDGICVWGAYGAKIISLSMLNELHELGLKKFLPYYVPQDVARRVFRFNSNPTSWWIGQMLKYILKPRSHVQAVINDTIAKMNFDTPIVGVQFRNMDKTKHGKGKFHDIDKYMYHVKEYYDQLALKHASQERRRVYLATNDAAVMREAMIKYPQYIFHSYNSKVKWKDGRRNNTLQAVTSLLVDIHILALCDYVVGTSSGNVGRMVYEMMQTNHVDAVNNFFSLDHYTYFFFKRKHLRIAVTRSAGDNHSIAFNVGDIIDVRCNFKNGNGYGTVLKTNMSGLISWYKTAEHIVNAESGSLTTPDTVLQNT